MNDKTYFQPYSDIDALQHKMEGMDDSEQRRFMRRLGMETHVALTNHIEDETVYKKKVDEMHTALFDPMNGLVNIRDWMCRIATRAGIVIIGGSAALASIASIGHSLGWY